MNLRKATAVVMIFNVWVFIFVDLFYWRGVVWSGGPMLAVITLVDVYLGLYLSVAVWRFETRE